MKPRRCVHALVEIGILRVHMSVEVNDPELTPMEILGDPPHGREAKGMIAAEHHGKRAAGVYV